MFSGTSKSANMKYWVNVTEHHSLQNPNQFNILPQSWAVCSVFMFLCSFPPRGQERETPEKREGDMFITFLQIHSTPNKIFMWCDAEEGHFPLVARNTGYLWHSWKWSEVRMLSYPYSTQSLCAVNQSNTGFKVSAELFFLLTGSTNPSLDFLFIHHIA